MSVSVYLDALDRAVRRGDATEHTHRPALKVLLETFGPKIEATNEPQRIAGNAPDFVVRRAAAIIGHVEAKDIGEPLNKVLKSDQIKRYREALPNLLLTDYLEFLWIENGELKLRARLGTEDAKGIVAAEDAEDAWKKITQAFFNAVAPTIKSPSQLAKALAGQTRLLRDLAVEVLKAGDGDLKAQHQAFEQSLVPRLTEGEFADMYAQTVAYGLFTARSFDQTSQDFSLAAAEALIPTSNPFLRRFFRHIGGPDLSQGLRWLIEQIVQLLLHADMDAVIRKQQRKAGFEDPVFHFYETFLAEYDRRLREQRGVYYTPEAVVDYLVRGVDQLLKTVFGREAGLADPSALILDPAVGTATFLRRVIEQVYRHQTDAGLLGAWPDYVREKLLPRLFGFELMMAPYTVAHLKLALELSDRGFAFQFNERLHVYLTNALDRVAQRTATLFERWLTEESAGAERVKTAEPVQVVLGNPPYSGESQNTSEWIMELMERYKREPDGSRLREKNSKWVNDDYVKFIRFAHWRVMQTGHGVIAFITNHGWLDNPTFRGMRAALLTDFDEIRVLDLHGNAKKRERTPAALVELGVDKNVFDIEQGVAICFLVRRERSSTKSAATVARVFHAQLWGSREHKYEQLKKKSLDSTQWRELKPSLPRLPFVPVDEVLESEYARGWSVTKIFPLNGSGIVTKSDELNIHWSAHDAWGMAQWLINSSEVQVRAKYRVPAPKVRDWSFARAKQDVEASGPSYENVRAMLYRPFDTRWCYYTGCSRGVMGWPAKRLMRHLLDGRNVALITARSNKSPTPDHFFCADKPVETKCGESTTQSATLPLWLEPEEGESVEEQAGYTRDAFASNTRRPNLNSSFLAALATAIGEETHVPFGLPHGVSAEDVFHYVYAVLYAPTYRSRYAEFLKSDFPRVLLPSDAFLFRALARLGEQLVDLHLLRDPVALDERAPRFPTIGDNTVEKPRYEPPAGGEPGRVWINARQRFEGIDRATWGFSIGGYQVLEKWLKDRKGRALSYDDITHYRRVAAALAGTQVLMDEIDQAAAPLFR